MKKILALILVLSLFGALVACTQVTRISIDNPSEIKLEKADGGLTLVLTDRKTVERITCIELAGSQIRWEGNSYKFSIGVDLSVLTDALETIPGLNK